MGEMNILQTRAYELNNEEKVPIIKKWLGRNSSHFIQTFTNFEKEACKTAEGLFKMFGETFKLQHNEMCVIIKTL